MARAPKSRSPFDVHPSVSMVEKWIATLKEKSGRSLVDWVALVKSKGPADEAGRRNWLKSEHGLGTNSAWWIAARAEGKGWEDGDPAKYLAAAEKYVEAMYGGPKAGLKPLYDRLLEISRALGSDVKVSPCQTIVPIYRNHVIAQIKPTTRTRIDFGLALKDKKVPARLLDTGGFAKKDRITRRIPIVSLADIDDGVARWLKVAYDMDA